MHQFSNCVVGADVSIGLVTQNMAEVLSCVIKEGRAEHYRNITWVAAKSGHRWLALRYPGRYTCPASAGSFGRGASYVQSPIRLYFCP